MDITLTKEHFHLLTTQQKYQELLKIFVVIKDKNDNCRYIYEKLTTKKELFDDQLMRALFDDVMQVYSQVIERNKVSQANALHASHSALEKIYDAEKLQKAQNEKGTEALLESM